MSALEVIRLRNDQYQAYGGLKSDRHSAEDVPLLLAAVEGVLGLHQGVGAVTDPRYGTSEPAGSICTRCHTPFPCYQYKIINEAITAALDPS